MADAPNGAGGKRSSSYQRQTPGPIEEGIREPKDEADNVEDLFGDWWDSHGGKGEEYRYHISRWDGSKWVHLKTYKNCDPDYDEVGNEFGGGDFNVTVKSYVKGKRCESSRRFTLGDHFGAIAERNRLQNARVAPAGPAGFEQIGAPVSAGIDLASQIQIIEKLVDLVGKLNSGVNKTPPLSAALGQYKEILALGDFVRRQDQRILQTARKEDDEEEAETVPLPNAPTDIMGWLKTLITQYAPMLAGAAIPALKPILNTVLSSPQYQTIAQDPKAVREIYGVLVEKCGMDRAKLLMKELGVNIDLVPQQ
jgi:hypothetical protein